MSVSALGHHVGERYNHHCLEGIAFHLYLLAVILKACHSLPIANVPQQQNYAPSPSRECNIKYCFPESFFER
jgi:hypothetical protein